MKKLIDWVLGLFKKPEPEIIFEGEPWPFPAPVKKKKMTVPKATTRKPAVKKPAAKKTVAKKTAVKASPLLKAMKQEQKEVKKILKQKAK